MAKPKYNPDQLDKLALYENVVARFPDIKRKGAKNPYTSVNGHMFSFLMQDGVLAIRLSKQQRTEFMDKYKTEQPVTYNTVMKEYVSVPGELLQDTDRMAEYFQMSFDYVSSLKPKPTTKKN
ncbi:MAG: hypothetical protein AAF490_28555 [Chloroflexota bacterium]